MTEEDYEKKYKKALATAKDCLKDGTVTRTAIDYIETIFPELKESEDERIRHCISICLTDASEKRFDDFHTTLKDCLLWLEKQGINYSLVEEIKKRKDSFMREKEKAVSSNDKLSLGARIAMLEELLVFVKEKQGEQKPVIDFKAKNWYVSKVDGKIHNIYYSVDKVEPKFKVRYAGGEYNVLEVKDIAGVTFYGIEDEPNHIDYVKAENCEIISGYAIKENGSPYPTKSAVFSEKKPTAWSDEDEHRVEDTIYYLDTAKKHYAATIGLDACIDWLKSLKDRIGG